MEFDKRKETSDAQAPKKDEPGSLSEADFLGKTPPLSPTQVTMRRLMLSGVHEWQDESTAPPVDLDALRALAAECKAVADTLELGDDGCPTSASMNRLAEVVRQLDKERADRLSYLIDHYRSWALAWIDLTAEEMLGD